MMLGQHARTTMQHTITTLAQHSHAIWAGIRKGKRSLLVCHTRRKCPMETCHNSVKAKCDMRVIKLPLSLIFWEVTVKSRVSECNLTIARGILHILYTIHFSTIKLLE